MLMYIINTSRNAARLPTAPIVFAYLCQYFIYIHFRVFTKQFTKDRNQGAVIREYLKIISQYYVYLRPIVYITTHYSLSNDLVPMFGGKKACVAGITRPPSLRILFSWMLERFNFFFRSHIRSKESFKVRN